MAVIILRNSFLPCVFITIAIGLIHLTARERERESVQNTKHAVAISHLLFGHDLSDSTKSAASEAQASPLALPLLFFPAAEPCQVPRAASRQGVPASTLPASSGGCLRSRQKHCRPFWLDLSSSATGGIVTPVRGAFYQAGAGRLVRGEMTSEKV